MSDTTFENLIIYITFRQTKNNDIGYELSNLYNRWLHKNKHKKRYIFFSCEQEYLEDIELMESIPDGNAKYTDVDHNMLGEMINNKMIDNKTNEYGEFKFNINIETFKQEMGKIKGNSIIIISGHGSQVLNNDNIKAHELPVIEHQIEVNLNCNTTQQGEKDDTNKLLLDISRKNKKKIFLFIFNSCHATHILDNIEDIQNKNLLLILPANCGRMNNTDIYNLTCKSSNQKIRKLEYPNDLSTDFQFKNYTRIENDKIFIDFDCCDDGKSCAEYSLICQQLTEAEKRIDQLNDVEMNGMDETSLNNHIDAWDKAINKVNELKEICGRMDSDSDSDSEYDYNSDSDSEYDSNSDDNEKGGGRKTRKIKKQHKKKIKKKTERKRKLKRKQKTKININNIG